MMHPLLLMVEHANSYISKQELDCNQANDKNRKVWKTKKHNQV